MGGMAEEQLKQIDFVDGRQGIQELLPMPDGAWPIISYAGVIGGTVASIYGLIAKRHWMFKLSMCLAALGLCIALVWQAGIQGGDFSSETSVWWTIGPLIGASVCGLFALITVFFRTGENLSCHHQWTNDEGNHVSWE